MPGSTVPVGGLSGRDSLASGAPGTRIRRSIRGNGAGACDGHGEAGAESAWGRRTVGVAGTGAAGALCGLRGRMPSPRQDLRRHPSRRALAIACDDQIHLRAVCLSVSLAERMKVPSRAGPACLTISVEGHRGLTKTEVSFRAFSGVDVPGENGGFGFDAFVSVDRGIRCQQSVDKLPVPIDIMLAVRNRLAELQSLVPQVLNLLSGDLQVQVYRVSERAKQSVAPAVRTVLPLAGASHVPLARATALQKT